MEMKKKRAQADALQSEVNALKAECERKRFLAKAGSAKAVIASVPSKFTVSKSGNVYWSEAIYDAVKNSGGGEMTKKKFPKRDGDDFTYNMTYVAFTRPNRSEDVDVGEKWLTGWKVGVKRTAKNICDRARIDGVEDSLYIHFLAHSMNNDEDRYNPPNDSCEAEWDALVGSVKPDVQAMAEEQGYDFKVYLKVIPWYTTEVVKYLQECGISLADYKVSERDVESKIPANKKDPNKAPKKDEC